MKKYTAILCAALLLLLLTGCSPQIKLFTDTRDPLQEFTLSGEGDEKVLVVPVRGVITDSPDEKLLRSQPGMVRKVVSHLDKAAMDDDIKAVLLKVDSPGGTITASDLLYHELLKFRERTGVKLVVSMMDLATSGGYYISLPADRIMAHPTTITGSVGVVFLRPVVAELLGKLGVEVNSYTTGKNKDMGSPFRRITPEEQEMLQNLIDDMGKRFLNLVARHRQLPEGALDRIATARIFLADEAKALGLIDDIGYLDDALDLAKELAGLPENARVVVYRRTEFPEDNIYNTASTRQDGTPSALIHMNLPEIFPAWNAGFYYLWPQALTVE